MEYLCCIWTRRVTTLDRKFQVRQATLLYFYHLLTGFLLQESWQRIENVVDREHLSLKIKLIFAIPIQSICLHAFWM